MQELTRITVGGQRAVGDITNNGERLVSMCEENVFVIGGTLFFSQIHPQANLDITRWKQQSQIDNIMINSK